MQLRMNFTSQLQESATPEERSEVVFCVYTVHCMYSEVVFCVYTVCTVR